jgi:hypothetical protein
MRGERQGVGFHVVRRVQKSAFLRRSRFVSCVCTQVHMTACLFVRICLHVACTRSCCPSKCRASPVLIAK